MLDAFELGQAISILPSLSKSPTAMFLGVDPTVKVTADAKDIVPLVEVFLNTATVPFPLFATTRSINPSPLKSATAIPSLQVLPGVRASAVPNEGVPITELVFRNTFTILEPFITLARSILPSPSKSAPTEEPILADEEAKFKDGLNAMALFPPLNVTLNGLWLNACKLAIVFTTETGA